MSFNRDVADLLERTAAMLELTGADRFRVNAYERAARALRQHGEDLKDVAQDEKTLAKIDGIGKGMAANVAEFARTGSLEKYDELAKEVPAGLLNVIDLEGVGPKTAKRLWEELGVTSIDELEAAVTSGAVAELPRLGTKKAELIREAIEFSRQEQGRIPLGTAMPIAEAIIEHLRGVAGVNRIAFAGSLRRGRETIGDIDILAAADDPVTLRTAFVEMEAVDKVLLSGDTKTSLRFNTGGSRLVQVDLRIVEEAAFGAALMYFTGSKEHNVRLRERAIKKGMTLNEYGVFEDDSSSDEPPQKRGVTPVAAATEEDIYAALGLPWVPPELREDRGEVREDFSAEGVIEVAQIKAELHAHTTASDGHLSIEQLAQSAIDRGFHTLVVTDHSQSSAIANGLSPDRLRSHIREVREVAARLEGTLTLLAGSEVDILADGSLDYDDDLLAELDFVVASPHAALNQDPKRATKRLLKAIEHPRVHVIGHPTGRMITRREGIAPDMGALAKAAAANSVALEINANPRRLDLRDDHVRVAIDKGALIAIDCDVHRAEHYDFLRYGVMTARRAGLKTERCVNAWESERLLDWIRSKHS
jgi:DNA polymerase (family X)